MSCPSCLSPAKINVNFRFGLDYTLTKYTSFYNNRLFVSNAYGDGYGDNDGADDSNGYGGGSSGGGGGAAAVVSVVESNDVFVFVGVVVVLIVVFDVIVVVVVVVISGFIVLVHLGQLLPLLLINGDNDSFTCGSS